ncbi:MAG: hypothetical protein ACJA0X_000386 [Cyclobacteriaceae bacterium]|jgi:hypothetical protein
MIMNKNYCLVLMLTLLFVSSCDDEDIPAAENDEELITDISLIFSPQGGAAPLTFNAIDPDGAGVENLQVEGDIVLAVNTTYELFIEMRNTIENEDIGEEVKEEGDEHQIFFGFTEDLFANPTGSGNISPSAGTVIYDDQDENNLPIGLITTWRTEVAGSGIFRILLKHQPDLKTATSTSATGSSDIDITWAVEIK